MIDWAELPRDVIGLIASFLPLADTHRFSVVCQNWFSVTNETRYPPLPQLPWLVLTDDEVSGKRRFFNMSEKKHYHFDMPELHGAFIVGSSFGWLFAMGPRLDAYLVNPFSGAKIFLPSLPIYHEELRPEILADHVERDEKGRPSNDCFELVQQILVKKAILSADPSKCTDFTVLISLNGDYRLAFYKFGDTSWTVFDYEEGLDDIIFFKGQFYALLACNVLATVDICPHPKLREHKLCVSPCYSTWHSYLVEYNGTSLLVVTRRQKEDENDDDHHITTQFRVFKVDLESYNSNKLANIEGHALFLGKNCSIVIRASDFDGCMANSIYFSSDAYLYIPEQKYGYDDLGVYKLEDKSIQHFCPPEYHPIQSCPIWMVPNKW